MFQGCVALSPEPNIGTAYGFFEYAGEQDIMEEVPHIRSFVETPSELTLNSVKGTHNLDTQNDSALDDVVQMAKQHNLSHVLKATLHNTENMRVASFLGDVMSGIANLFYDTPKQFNAEIVYHDGEQSVFK